MARSTRSRIFLPVLLAACFMLSGSRPARAGDTAAQITEARQSIHIEADRMESDQQQKTVRFEGSVEARQGELIIRADSMEVHYSAQRPNPHQLPGPSTRTTRKIERLHAEGQVEIIKKDWVAAGDLVDYFAGERKVVLTGNTRVWRDNNLVTGDRIILLIDEEKSIVEGKDEQGGRVNAFFYPEPSGRQTPPKQE